MKAYEIMDNGRRLPEGGPLKAEYWGSVWIIERLGEKSGDVWVPDPGDGSAFALAAKIRDLLNGEQTLGSRPSA